MKSEEIKIKNFSIPFVKTTAAVVGSGAASLNAALNLKRFGVDVIIVTEKLGAGTSANTGSDKQTVYRVDPSSIDGDSIYKMANELFKGGSMHGDIALVESALSLHSFYGLVSLGVPFPFDTFGIFAGYKTDHDTKSRGTSAGPKTSILMYEKLLNEIKKLDIRIIDKSEVVDIVTQRTGDEIIAQGLICIERDKVNNKNFGLLAIECDYIVYGTGGPAALYRDSVYPQSQIGSTGIPIVHGALAQNLTEVQFGIASVGFRWNLSGSYQQVLPRFYSTEPDGSDENDFLQMFFPDAESMLEAQFSKGYEWPFDVKKVADYASSCIDLLVYYERIVRKRKVFMDFTANPSYPAYEFSMLKLPSIASEYLSKSNAVGNVPVERLQQMNYPAYEIYKDNGIDLAKEPLEIAISHQHCNGGLQGSIWWESNIKNFYPVGECNGSHGVYRPGGSALNSGQVGALRAAQSIAHRAGSNNIKNKDIIVSFVENKFDYFSNLLKKKAKVHFSEERIELQSRMSSTMGIVRSEKTTQGALSKHLNQMKKNEDSGIDKRKHLLFYLKNLDLLHTERLFLESSKAILKKMKGSRGSYLKCDMNDLFILNEDEQCIGLNKIVVDESLDDKVVVSGYEETLNPVTYFDKARPIPEPDTWFEKVWSDFMTGKIYEE